MGPLVSWDLKDEKPSMGRAGESTQDTEESYCMGPVVWRGFGYSRTGRKPVGLELTSQTRAGWRPLLLFKNGLSPSDSDFSLEL